MEDEAVAPSGTALGSNLGCPDPFPVLGLCSQHPLPSWLGDLSWGPWSLPSLPAQMWSCRSLMLSTPRPADFLVTGVPCGNLAVSPGQCPPANPAQATLRGTSSRDPQARPLPAAPHRVPLGASFTSHCPRASSSSCFVAPLRAGGTGWSDEGINTRITFPGCPRSSLQGGECHPAWPPVASERGREEGARPSEAVVLSTVLPAGLQHQQQGGCCRPTVWGILHPMFLFRSSQIGSLGL